MPTYVYRCSQCRHEFDVRHGMRESYDGQCRECDGVNLQRGSVPPRYIFVTASKNRNTPTTRSITTGQKSGAPGIRMGFRDGYKSALARYPGDPKAYVSSKREAVRRAEELGVSDDITFSADDVAPD